MRLRSFYLNYAVPWLHQGDTLFFWLIGSMRALSRHAIKLNNLSIVFFVHHGTLIYKMLLSELNLFPN